jgi:DNA-binding protein HU-beta
LGVGPGKCRRLAVFRAGGPYCGDFMRVFSRPRDQGYPPQGDTVNKAELTAALAMRTKMSKAEATRTIEALFDDKGIIAGELKKGAKVQITGFGNFEARKRAARQGRNPKTGSVIQIKASIAPAFRAGKQLKMAVNTRK